MKILLASAGGMNVWLLLRLMREGHECEWFDVKPEPRTNLVLKGLVPPPLKKKPDFSVYDLVIFDCTDGGELAQEAERVTPVIGDSELASKLEDDRLFGIETMEEAGIEVPPYETFENPEEAKQFISENPKRYVYKPFTIDGEEQPCETTYVSDSADDLIRCIDGLFEESHNAPFLLQEVVEGTEISTEGYFDGTYFHFLNHTLEEKKFMSGSYGPNTGCYSEDTEILSAGGWKKYQDLEVGMPVATINPTTREMQYQPIQKLWEYQWNGDMVNFRSKTMDLMVTPDHRMLYSTGAEMKWKRADEAIKLNDSRAFIPRKSVWLGKEQKFFTLPSPDLRTWKTGHGSTRNWKPEPMQIPMDDWIAFLGLYLSEGSCKKNVVSIAQTKPAPYMQEVIDKLPFKSCKIKNGWEITSTQLAEYLRPLGYSWEKRIPREFMSLSSRQLGILLYAMIQGDGTTKEDGQRFYFTSSEGLAGDVQELFQKTGSEAVLRVRDRVGEPVKCKSPGITRHLSYELYERRKPNSYIRRLERSVQQYSGVVWCVTVPNGTVYVRRNGNAAWCGNCSGNLVWVLDRPNRLAKELMKLAPFLHEAGYHGMIDLNTIVNESHAYGLEFTPRFGYDASASIFSLIDGDLGKFFYDIATAPDQGYIETSPVPPLRGTWAASVRLTVPPYPAEDADYPQGIPIKGIDLDSAWRNCYMLDAMIDKQQHSGEEGLVTVGLDGIVACPIASAYTPEGAWKGLERISKSIKFPNMQKRDDLEKTTSRRLKEVKEMGWLE